MESPFVQKAIPMISVDEKTGKYVMTNEAIKFLRAIPGPIGVVSVAGLYRTGKSYLLNRMLLNKSNGFGVGPTVNPCTKGLWCWGTPLKGTNNEGESVNIVVIDTEGIGALDQDQTHDTKIFTLAILASSCFIYNSVGSIDENAVQNLSLVVNLTKHIQLKAENNEDGIDPEQVASYFPSFFWVVRDFSLQLQDAQGKSISSKEYLQKALAPQPGFSEDTEQKNRIRRLLTSFFKERDCFTLIRPLVNQELLQKLDTIEFEDLRPDFATEVIKFRKRILSGIKIKTLQDQRLDGNMYLSMMHSYVKAINDGAVPNIQNAWNYMCEQQCIRSMNEAYEAFLAALQQKFKDFPCSEDDYNTNSLICEQIGIEHYRSRSIGSNSEMHLKDLKKNIRKQLQDLKDENIKQSSTVLKNYLIKSVSPLQKKLSSQEYKSYSELQSQISTVYQNMKKAGPKLHNYQTVYLEGIRKFASQGAQFFFKTIRKEYQKNTELNKQREKQYTIEIQKLKQDRDNFRRKHSEFTTESDQKMMEMSNKIIGLENQLRFMIQNKQREEQKNQRLLNNTKQEIQHLKSNNETKVRQMVNRYEESIKEVSLERKQLEKEKALLEHKLQQQQKMIEELQKKEKLLDGTLLTYKSKVEMISKELKNEGERQKDEIAAKFKQQVAKLNQMIEDFKNEKQELEGKLDSMITKQKKQRQQSKLKGQQLQKLKRETENQIKILMTELQTKTIDFDIMQKNLQERLRQKETVACQNIDKSNKEKVRLQNQIAILKQNEEFARSILENAQRNIAYLQDRCKQLEEQMEARANETRAETQKQVIQNLKTQHAEVLEKKMEQFENEKKKLVFELERVQKSYEELQIKQRLTSNNLANAHREFTQSKESLKQQIENLRNQMKKEEREKSTYLSQIQQLNQMKIRQLEKELEEVKEKNENERRQNARESEDVIKHLRANYEFDKTTMQKRLIQERDRSEKKLAVINQEWQRKMKDQIEPLQQQNQDLREQLANLEEQYRTTSNDLQHEVDINKKRGDTYQKMAVQLKEMLAKKENDFNSKMQAVQMQFKVQRRGLQEKVDSLIGESNKKDMQLMSITHQRDQHASALEKRQVTITELQLSFANHREKWAKQNEMLQAKIADENRQHFNNISMYVRDIALQKQENDFNLVKMKELQKNLQLSNQNLQMRIKILKQQKQVQIKNATEKAMSERNAIEDKYRQYKTTMKEQQIGFRKSISDLSKEKAILDEKLNNYEIKLKQSEQKRLVETKNMNNQIIRLRQMHQNLRKSSSEELERLRRSNQFLENDRNNLNATLQRERSLNTNKINFDQQKYNQLKEESELKYSKLLMKYEELNASKASEQNRVASKHNDALNSLQGKLQSKIRDLNEELSRRISQNQANNRAYESEIKILKEKYELEKVNRQNTQSMASKKQNEYVQQLKKCNDDIDYLRGQINKKEVEYRKRIQSEKDIFKSKLGNMQTKLKQTQNAKTSMYLTTEKEKTKWKMQHQQLNDSIANYKDTVSKLERERDRYRADWEKLKAEKKNTNRNHSYISNLKPTYIETSKREQDKENVNQQMEKM